MILTKDIEYASHLCSVLITTKMISDNHIMQYQLHVARSYTYIVTLLLL